MINKIISKLKIIAEKLNEAVVLDIEDVKKANHESLADRNVVKLDLMDNLIASKQKLNDELAAEYKSGGDISIYKNSVDELEEELKKLYYSNGKLASIVLPVKEMYKEIIDEITTINGGTLVEVMA